jgi:hypothetical protein
VLPTTNNFLVNWDQLPLSHEKVGERGYLESWVYAVDEGNRSIF